MTLLLDVWELWLMIFRAIPILFSDVRYLLILLFILLMVNNQYRKVHALEASMFQLQRGAPWRDTLQSFGYGLIGGLLASVAFLFLGVSLSQTGILYLWGTAAALLLVHPRFMCFAYAGGIVSLVSLVFGAPQIHVPAVMALVALLHMVEAVLIWMHGGQRPTPIYLKHDSGGVVGGFSLQRVWPLPFVALIGMVFADASIGFETMAMPDWWPLIQPTTPVPMEHSMIYLTFPVIAALGYSDVAVTSSPQTKARASAALLFAFSVGLLSLAIASMYVSLAAWAAALFSPLAHEWVIHKGQKREREGVPLFTLDEGVMVLDVRPHSPAEAMGLRMGDIITSVNDRPVATPKALMGEMQPWLVNPDFHVKNVLEGMAARTVSYRGTIPPIGIILAPHRGQGVFMEFRDGLIPSWIRRLFARRTP